MTIPHDDGAPRPSFPPKPEPEMLLSGCILRYSRFLDSGFRRNDG